MALPARDAGARRRAARVSSTRSAAALDRQQKSRVSRRFSSCRTRRCTRIFWGAVLQPTPPPPPSSSASAPALVLRLGRRACSGLWWGALHALLAAAAALVGWPWCAQAARRRSRSLGHARRAAAAPVAAGPRRGRRTASAPCRSGIQARGRSAHGRSCARSGSGSISERGRGGATYCCSPTRSGPTSGGGSARCSRACAAIERRASRSAAAAGTDLS